MMHRKVTFVTGTSVVWGAEISMLTLAAHSKLAPELLCSSDDLGDEWARIVRTKAHVVRARRSRIGRNFGFLLPILKAAKQSSVLVVFDFYLLPTFVALLPLLRLLRCRLVIDIHDGAERNRNRKPYFLLTIFADVTIAVSDYILLQLPRSAKTCRIYRPVEAAAVLSAPPMRSTLIRFGIVGQISPDKGLEFAFESLKHLRPDISVHLRGSATRQNSDYKARITQSARQTFGNNFFEEGKVPRHCTMLDLDVLFVTNSTEPFGRVAAEAQLSGVLVVGPSSGGIGEIITDGATGFSYKAGDVSAAQDAVRRSIEEHRAPTGVAERALAHAVNSFDPVRQSKKYDSAIIATL